MLFILLKFLISADDIKLIYEVIHEIFGNTTNVLSISTRRHLRSYESGNYKIQS